MRVEPDNSVQQGPWYKQFWLMFILALLAAAVIASVITVYIAYDGSDDLVTQEYYKNGLAINRAIDKQQVAKELNLQAEVEIDALSVTVQVVGVEGEQQLNLALSHPIEADRDILVSLQEVAKGTYTGTLSKQLYSKWYWALENQPSDASQPQWQLYGWVTLPRAEQ